MNSKANKLICFAVVAKIIFLIGLLFLASISHAKEGEILKDIESIKVIAPVVNYIFGKSTLDLFVKTATGMAGKFTGFALQLAGLLALISVLWSVMMAMSSKQHPLAAIIEPLVFAVLTALFLSNYGVIVNDVVALGQKAIEFSGSSVGDAFSNFFNSMFGGVFKIMKSIYDRFSFTLDFGKALIEALIAIFLLIVALVMTAYSIKNLVSTLLLGPILLGIGVAVGPLAVAALASKFSRPWFKKWVEHLIASALLTAFVVIVLVLLKEAITSIVSEVIGDGDGTIGKLLALVIIIASLADIFDKLPSVANAMMPGSTGISSGGMLSNGVTNSISRAGVIASGIKAGAAGAAQLAKAGFQRGASGSSSNAASGATAAKQAIQSASQKSASTPQLPKPPNHNP